MDVCELLTYWAEIRLHQLMDCGQGGKTDIGLGLPLEFPLMMMAKAFFKLLFIKMLTLVTICRVLSEDKDEVDESDYDDDNDDGSPHLTAEREE